MKFTITLMITTQIEKEKLWLCLMTRLLILRLIEKFQSIIKELIIKCRKLNISLPKKVPKFFLFFPKKVRLNSTHYVIMKIYNKRELHQIAINHLADIDFKDFMKI